MVKTVAKSARSPVAGTTGLIEEVSPSPSLREKKKKKARATGDTVVAVFGNHPLGPSHVQKALANLADTWLHGKQETPDPPLGHASGITGISPDM